MTREQIEKAALLCAGAGEYGECPYNPDAKKGFIAGAEWRINSVWHSPTEEQEAYRPILVEFTHEDGDLGFELGLRQICLSKEAESNMIRWAYLDDLLPERKEVRNDTRSEDVPSRVRWVRENKFTMQNS